MIDDVLFDDSSWRIRYLALRSGGWLNERVALVAPHTFLSVDQGAHMLHVSLSREQIE